MRISHEQELLPALASKGLGPRALRAAALSKIHRQRHEISLIHVLHLVNVVCRISIDTCVCQNADSTIPVLHVRAWSSPVRVPVAVDRTHALLMIVGLGRVSRSAMCGAAVAERW